MKKSTFSTACLRAIQHLSVNMQNRIIADVTRYQLTGELPENMPPMRRALVMSLILQLNSDADSSMSVEDAVTQQENGTTVAEATDSQQADVHAKPEPNYIAIAPAGHAVPLYIPPSDLTRPDVSCHNAKPLFARAIT